MQKNSAAEKRANQSLGFQPRKNFQHWCSSLIRRQKQLRLARRQWLNFWLTAVCGSERLARFAFDINLEPLPVGRVLITGGISGTKNHEERVIPLFPKLREVIQRIIDNAGDISPDSKLFNTLSPRDAMENAFQRLGVKGFSVHALRHYFASN